MSLTVTFGCGHTARLPHRPSDGAPARARTYWADQGLPALPGAVAACPGCITGRQPRGALQVVTRIAPAQ